ncbi:MAG: HAD family hydrolase [Atopobiaceae bacterium]|jgi:phosphoglycolate phosphatase|nr:HAD family hydrolase [Atopobiaceae bacterium]MCI2174034.1 HAD family hydrolase [Atopobiaceae bacterium]MCI2207876.1 HAD family hydrolase [Atopobiaceae bacterium]
MRYQAALLDMDGTILDTLEDLHLAVNHVLDERGLPLRTLAQTRATVGHGILSLVHDSCPEGTPDDVVRSAFDDFNDWYKVHCADHTHPYEGIPELLRDLRHAGVALAVVSNKSDYAVQELAERYFPDAFDCAMGAHAGCPKKPDPAMCRLALEAMDVDADKACYVGDSEVDVATAANARLDGIICEWGFRDRDVLVAAGATTLVPDVAALRDLLLG